MGHIAHFLSLAAMLASRNCTITLITAKPIVCAEEFSLISSFFSSHPNIICLDFHILPGHNPSSSHDDSFITQFKAINHSVHLLPSLLSSLPQPVSAIFSDFVVAASLAQITAELGVPNYIVSTTSAWCYSTVAYLPLILSNTPAEFKDGFDEIEIPGLSPLPRSTVPPSWLDNSPSNQLLTEYLVPNAKSLPKVGGILLNSFTWFEQETIGALLEGRVLSDLPPLYPIGPFEHYNIQNDHGLPWLDEQASWSIVYVNFGGRVAMSRDQVRELGKGLERSGYSFLWVLTANGKEILQELVGEGILGRNKDKGVVMEGWVNQAAILAHRATGGFINQCEWGSVTEAARAGVPVLAWPQHGDHKMNAEVVKKAGLGIWDMDWGWGGERLVSSEEIEEKVRELMSDENIRNKAKKVGEEARKAFDVGGSSENALMSVIKILKQREG